MAVATRLVPASATPSPSLRQSGDMPTWVAAARSVPYSCWKAPSPAVRSQGHAHKAWNGVHRPAGSHASQQYNTNYDLDNSESDSIWGACGPVSVLSNLCKRQADLNGGHPVFLYLNLAKNLAYNLYILYRFWKCTRAAVNQLWPNRPEVDLVSWRLVNFGPA